MKINTKKINTKRMIMSLALEYTASNAGKKDKPEKEIREDIDFMLSAIVDFIANSSEIVKQREIWKHFPDEMIDEIVSEIIRMQEESKSIAKMITDLNK